MGCTDSSPVVVNTPHPARRLALLLSVLLLLADGCTTSPKASYQTELTNLASAEFVLSPSLSYLTLHIDDTPQSASLASFRQFAASLDFDQRDLRQTRLQAIIHMQSVEADDQIIANRLTSAEWFNTRRFPIARFHTNDITLLSNDRFLINGELAIRGITRPMVLESQFIGAAINPLTDQRTLAFNATGTFSQSDFGINIGPTDHQVTMQMYAEFLPDNRVAVP